MVQFRIGDTEKIKVVQILDRLGLSLLLYLGMCVLRLNQENEIPFSTELDPEPDPNIRVLNRVSRIAEEYGISDMTLEEVNAEIIEARKQMPVKYSTVIDTNVLVSAALKQKSVPGNIIEFAFDGPITPVLDEDIEAKYREVLSRPKFHLTEDTVSNIIDIFHQRDLYTDSETIDIDLSDPRDGVFYEAVMEECKDEDAYLVIGNIRHFPTAPFIVTPRQIPDIVLKGQEG